MPMFIHRPKPQEAVQWHKPGDHPAVVHVSSEHVADKVVPVWGILTSDGSCAIRVHPGYWILSGVRGEIEVMEPVAFAETYRPLDDGEIKHFEDCELYRNEAGLTGSYWRLAERISPREVMRWLDGERIRGVPPLTMFEAMGEYIGIIASYTAAMVGRVMMHSAAGKIYEWAHAKTSAELREADEQKRARELLKRPGLTLVKN